MEQLLTPLLSGLGLSGAAGLNAYLPLLLVGLLNRFGVLHLAEPYSLLSSPWVLGGVLLLLVLDFIGDKIPGVDHALHVFGGVLNAGSGALLFAAQSGVVTGHHLNPTLALLLGLLVSGGVHTTRTLLRPVSTGLTGGLGNPVVSSAEDGSSLVLSVLAIFAPLLAVVLLVVLLLGAWRVLARVRRRFI
ncbi:DUF4126 domain-containing protein [Deinococcus sp. KNUC1210]|uniref:DUF4126 domain-containing protein n=1 Tax=Deinococcus sp. KNUC1210 TaxID=2917691 RepID=UPI001EEF7A0B|nr:DUF4126 domain-containing protein [Deinococcus sp. KNUC1210]ULH15253.1 DUF4126 domain-containing protein [Deinococcus sp. KNUC1210]